MSALRFAELAESDVLEAWLHVATESVASADRLIDAIEAQARLVSRRPRMGRQRPELGPRVRCWPTGTPYLLFYVETDAGITVLRVLHHARDLELAFGEGERPPKAE